MLWDLYGAMAGQVYRSWNTCVKLVWDLPRSTHNFFVDHLLAGTLPSVRKSILTKYISFLQRLRKSVSKETRVMSQIAAADIRSVTGRNCLNLSMEFDLHPWFSHPGSFKSNYKWYLVPDMETTPLDFPD